METNSVHTGLAGFSSALDAQKLALDVINRGVDPNTQQNAGQGGQPASAKVQARAVAGLGEKLDVQV